MRVALLQSDIAWEDPAANFARLGPRIEQAATAGARLAVLPEMFACGFSMSAEEVAEDPEGPSESFLHEQARRYGLWTAGSLPRRSPQGRPGNCLIVAGPQGEHFEYNKIHPFSAANEHLHYRAGTRFLCTEIEGVRLSWFVCYDLRFADEFWPLAPHTDAYVVVANWPQKRRLHWSRLLCARAIENQAYALGINRVGEGNGLKYSGDSAVYDPWGETLVSAAGDETTLLVEIDPARVRDAREKFSFVGDRRAPEAISQSLSTLDDGQIEGD